MCLCEDLVRSVQGVIRHHHPPPPTGNSPGICPQVGGQSGSPSARRSLPSGRRSQSFGRTAPGASRRGHRGWKTPGRKEYIPHDSMCTQRQERPTGLWRQTWRAPGTLRSDWRADPPPLSRRPRCAAAVYRSGPRPAQLAVLQPQVRETLFKERGCIWLKHAGCAALCATFSRGSML